INPDALERALQTIQRNMERQIAKGLLTEAQQKAAMERIQPFSDLSEGVKTADLVVEAATENEGLKLQLFRDLDTHCPSPAVLASNTSAIFITQLAAVTSRHEKVIGMHFMNPVPVMPLVEVMKGYHTAGPNTNKMTQQDAQLDRSDAGS